MDLTRKSAIVTGASEGIGREITLKLANHQMNLALIARTQSKLEEIQHRAQTAGAQMVNIYPCDITDLDQVTTTMEQIKKDFDFVHILINNAGIWHKRGSLTSIDHETIDKVISTNLTGLIHITKIAIPKLREVEDAAIINIASHSGIVAKPGQSVYAASKWGVRGLTETLARDFIHSEGEKHIKVAGIYQGAVNTDLHRKANEHLDTSTYIEPYDLADVVVYMLSRPPKLWLYAVHVGN